MNVTEFWMAWLFKLGDTVGFVAVILLIACVVLAFVLFASSFGDSGLDETVNKTAQKFLRVLVPALVVTGVLASIPDPQDMWKLRIALLKLEVASPENVQKVGGHVEEVVKALECKHLQINCPQPEKAP